jgi:hypothetical protein
MPRHQAEQYMHKLVLIQGFGILAKLSSDLIDLFRWNFGKKLPNYLAALLNLALEGVLRIRKPPPYRMKNLRVGGGLQHDGKFSSSIPMLEALRKHFTRGPSIQEVGLALCEGEQAFRVQKVLGRRRIRAENAVDLVQHIQTKWMKKQFRQAVRLRLSRVKGAAIALCAMFDLALIAVGKEAVLF